MHGESVFNSEQGTTVMIDDGPLLMNNEQGATSTDCPREASLYNEQGTTVTLDDGSVLTNSEQGVTKTDHAW